MPSILIKPQDIALKSVNALAEDIIQQSLTADTIGVVGIGPAMSRTCAIVGVSTEIARISPRKILLDYVETPVVGPFDAIYFQLTTKPTAELPELVKRLESELVANRTGPGGQVVFVSKLAEIRRITTTCLYTIRDFDLVKIQAAGLAINSAVSAALQVVKLSKEPARIEAVTLEPIQSKTGGYRTTALSIYIRRGKVAERDPDLVRTLRDLKLIT